MTKSITITNKMTAIQQKQFDAQLHESGIEVNVGDMFFGDRDDTIIKVTKIEVENEWEWQGKKRKIHKDKFVFTVHYDQADNFECTKWSEYGSKQLDEFISDYGDNKIYKPLKELFAEALEVIEGKRNISDYKEKQINASETSEALLHAHSKETLLNLKKDLLSKSQHLHNLKDAVGFEMERRKAELEKVRKNLGLVLADFRKKVEQIQKVIGTIELYLGINEDIIQIQDGNKANVNEVIYFRQEVLFMDEEVGDPDDGGLDFKRIEDFDNWLTRNNNYKKVIPETKGIVAIRVRRDNKDYCDNPYINSMMNEGNMNTYILIRNGDVLYRIWGDIIIYPRLFPRRKELQELKDRWDTITEKDEGNGFSIELADEEGHTQYITPEKGRQEIDNSIFRYKQQFIMLQGLLDRTEVFNPVPKAIKLLTPDAQDEGLVRFIYDDETKLPDSRIEFWEWHKLINSEIHEGSRVFVQGHEVGDGSRLDKRFSREKHYDYRKLQDGIYTVYNYFTDETRIVWVRNPQYGVIPMDKHSIFNSDLSKNYLEEHKRYYSKQGNVSYMIEKKEKGKTVYEPYKEEHFYILFNPKDEVRNWWDCYDDGHERKKNLRYEIFRTDEHVFNYDAISLDDVEFYLNSRTNRRHYLNMMPLLYQMKNQRIEEMKWERGFVKLMLGRLKQDESFEPEIWKAIEWWKQKNKWKRPVRKDDAKALRMIENKLKSK